MPKKEIDITYDYYRIISEIEAYGQNNIELCQRKGSLVRPVSVMDANIDKSDKLQRDKQSLVIRDVDVNILKMILDKHIIFYKLKKEKNGNVKKVYCDITYDILSMLLGLGHYPNIPVLNGISESPFIRQDGTVCSKHGYDYSSGYFLKPNCKIEYNINDVSQDDAVYAYKKLSSIFHDFPFSKDEYRAIPIAFMLSIIARPMFGNVPAFVFEASTAGSGKTLLVDLCSIILFGREAPKQTWPEGRDANVELEKILSSVALDASPLLIFDNIDRNSKLRGAAIDKVLTSNGVVKFRILGKSKAQEMPWNTVIAITGNNAVANVYGDTRRRVCPCRIEPNHEHPEDRSDFKIKNIVEFVKNNRSELVWCLLAIIRGWVINGRNKLIDPIGSFDDWSHVIINSIYECSGINIKKCFDTVRDIEDDDYMSVSKILSILSKNITGYTTKDVSMKCKEDYDLKHSVQSAICDNDINTRKIGKFFASIEGRVYGGMKIVRGKKENNAIRWVVVNIKKAEQGIMEF